MSAIPRGIKSLQESISFKKKNFRIIKLYFQSSMSIAIPIFKLNLEPNTAKENFAENLKITFYKKKKKKNSTWNLAERASI